MINRLNTLFSAEFDISPKDQQNIVKKVVFNAKVSVCGDLL